MPIPIKAYSTLAILAGLLLSLAAAPSWAACTTPTGSAGDMIYNTTYNVMQFCNGDDWVNMGAAGGGAAEVDPQVGTLTAGNWCTTTDGSTLNCTSSEPVLTEADPQVGTLTPNYWCKSNGGGTAVDCTTSSITITADTLDFSELADSLTLDADTSIVATGTNVLSITNTGTGNSFVVNDVASDTTPFVIDASGNVGIGTTAPTQTLSVVRETSPAVLIGTDQTNKYGIIDFSDSTLALSIQGGVWGGTTRSVILNAGGGNVGIGTTSPSQKLDVAGNVNISNADPYLILYQSDQGTDGKRWDVFAAETGLNFRAVNDAYTAATNWLQVTRSGYGISTVSLPSGNVGIGTTSPGAKLNISHSSDGIGFRQDGGRIYLLPSTSTVSVCPLPPSGPRLEP